MIHRLDTSKNFGTVWGHPLVAFVQGGIDFDATGQIVVDTPEVVTDPVPKDSTVEDWVRAILAGGPVLQSNIHKEAEGAQHDWAEVVKVAAKIGVTNINKTWSLK